MANATTLATRVLQQAIDAAAAARGGVVIIPPGRHCTGTFWLRSHVTRDPVKQQPVSH